jgi:hypothetical protein
VLDKFFIEGGKKMKKNKIFTYAAFCFTLLLLIVPDICGGSDDGMEILANVDIITTPRHELELSISFNPVDDEFLVLLRTIGKIPEDCPDGLYDPDSTCANWDSIDGQRVSPDGELLGNPIELSPPETGHKSVVKSAHNIFRNEYLVAFSRGEQLEFGGMETNIMRIDNVGNILDGPFSLYDPPYSSGFAELVFNPKDRNYWYACVDKEMFPGGDGTRDVIGFILDEDGGTEAGPSLVGSRAGSVFNPQGVYNSIDNTCLFQWEDYRNTTPPYVPWLPCDNYGALLDADGNMIVEIPIMDDYGMPDGGDQSSHEVAYNPDRNEFLSCWAVDEQPSNFYGGIYGRIINGDGTLKGAPFVIADVEKPQNSPAIVYVQDKKMYFIVWVDYRNDTALEEPTPFYFTNEADMYGKWLKPSGEPEGPDIPIWTGETGEGKQIWPAVSYDPIMKRFLIAWQDYYAPGIMNLHHQDQAFGYHLRYRTAGV